MLTRRLGSRLMLYSVAVTAIAVLLAAKPILNIYAGDLSWQTSEVETYKRVPISGELSTWLQPLDKLLSQPKPEPRDISLEILKSRRMMRLKIRGKTVKTYVIGLGTNPDRKKTRRDDCATPEGTYYVCEKLPKSSFYLSLKISYPNIEDARRGLKEHLIDKKTFYRIENAIRGRQMPPMDTRLGGDICIHGGGAGNFVSDASPPYVDVYDWTQGCIAIRRTDIKELFDLIPLGATVTIRP